MTLTEKIIDDIKKAMKAKEANKLSILRMIKSTIKNKEIDKGDSLSDDDVQAVLRTFVNRAKDSIEQFSGAGRTELAEKEKEELLIIQEYLPKQLDEDSIKIMVKEAISETGASGPKEMGKVMKTVMAKTKGQADGKLVNKLVKEMLEA